MEKNTEKLAEQFVELFPRPFLEAVTEIKTNYRMKNLKWVTTQPVENFKVELSWDIYENSPIKIRKRVKLSDNNQDNRPKSIKLEPLQTVRVKTEPESPKIDKFASKCSIENNSIDTGAAEQKSSPIPPKSSSAPPKNVPKLRKNKRCRPGNEQMVNHCVNNGATPQKHKSSTIPSISNSAPPENDPNPVKNPKGLSSKSSSATPQNDPNPVKNPKGLSSKPEKIIAHSSVNNGWRNVVLESVIHEMYNGTVVIYGGDLHSGEGLYFSFPSLYCTEVTVISMLDNYYDFLDIDARIREHAVRTI
ncbi:hypothetical protein SNE40_001372 [Patella caerulea]|uniref:Uncharacterized protein n=1 Tax=Patella caerulea TaxID=87958 RepID=A0AAN8Q3F8_PATCE